MDEVGKLEASANSGHGASNLRERKPWWRALGGKDVSFVSVEDGYDDTSESEGSEATLSTNGVFVASEALEIYKPVEGFEGSHRFDVNATWTPEEEKRLVRRVRLASSRVICARLTR